MATRIISQKLAARFFVVMVGCLVAAGCSAAPQPTPTASSAPKPKTTFTISGASTALSVLKILKPALEADNPGLALQILESTGTSGNSSALKGISDKTLDFGALTRDLTSDQMASGIGSVVVGQVSIAAFVHPGVNITNITGQQLADIYAGRVTNWSQVGGPNLPVVLYVRQPDENVT